MRYMHEVSAEQWVTNEYYFNYKDSPIRRLRTPDMFELLNGTEFSREKNQLYFWNINIFHAAL